MTTYITADNKLHDDAEGNAIHLPSWPKNARIATQVEIDAIQNPPKTTEQQNNDIKAQLDIIDFKSIRALREGDAVRLKALDDQAKALRVQFK